MEDLHEWVLDLMRTEKTGEQIIPTPMEFVLSAYYESDGICYPENENDHQ